MTDTITMTFAALATLWHTRTDAVMITGYATYNNRMAEVAFNRGYIPDPFFYSDWLDEEGPAGTVALNAEADKNRRVWIHGPQGFEGPFLVIDCAQLAHLRQRLNLRRIVDVDHITGERWEMKGPIEVEVWFEEPTQPSPARDRPGQADRLVPM